VGDFFQGIVLSTGLWVPLSALFISHGFSFFKNFLGTADPPFDLLNALKRSIEIQKRTAELQKEGKRLLPDDPDRSEAQKLVKGFADRIQPLMTDPYRRIVVMHLTIIFGGMLSMVLRNPKAAFLLMVFLKIAVDAAAHVRKNFTPSPAEGSPQDR
jgi:hypothetical protein